MAQENKKTFKSKKDYLETLYTPKELADRGIISLVYQWRLRKEGKLKFYRLNTKIFYSEAHLKEFFESCEQN